MNKDCISRELTIEVVVGVFMVMILFGLGYFTFVVSGRWWGDEPFRVEAYFEDVMGLKEGDNVVVRGMPVGKVESLTLEKNRILVLAHCRKELSVREGYRVTIVATSILGGRYMEIHEGNGKLLDPGKVLQGTKPHDLMADAAELVNATKDGFSGTNGIIASLQETARELKEIARRVNAGEGTLGKLLSSDDKLYKDLSESVASLKNIAARLEKGEGTLGKLLSSDDQLHKDLSASVASLKNIAARLEKGEGTLGKLLSSDDKLYEDLSASVASLRNIAAGIEKGEGTIGMLIKDKKLYESLEQTVKELQAAIDDFRETSPVVTFTSIFFGAF